MVSFGFTIALDGDKLVVGDALNTDPVTLYDISSLGAVINREFAQPSANAERPTSAGYGVALAVNGDTLVVGGGYTTDLAFSQVFVYSISTGQLKSSLASSAGSAKFGRSLAIYGDNILVASDEAAPSQFTVFLFSASSGDLLQTYTHPNPGYDGSFGVAGPVQTPLAINGKHIVIGSPCDASEVVECPGGEVFLFNLKDNSVVRSFENPAPQVEGNFGSAIAVDGTSLLVGASLHDNRVGVAYLFRISSGELVATIESPTGTEGGNFGATLDIEDDTLFITSPMLFSGGPVGETYIYDATTLELKQTITGTVSQSGLTVAASRNDYLVIGEPDVDQKGGSGTVFVYERVDMQEPTAAPLTSNAPMQLTSQPTAAPLTSNASVQLTSQPTAAPLKSNAPVHPTSLPTLPTSPVSSPEPTPILATDAPVFSPATTPSLSPILSSEAPAGSSKASKRRPNKKLKHCSSSIKNIFLRGCKDSNFASSSKGKSSSSFKQQRKKGKGQMMMMMMK